MIPADQDDSETEFFGGTVTEMPVAAEALRLSDTDRKILSLLKQDARRSISEIAAIVGVTRASVRNRIDLMRERGVILRFTIEIGQSQRSESFGNSAFLHLHLKRSSCHIVFADVSVWPELVGCWSIAGDLDMILLVETASAREIDRLRELLSRHKEVEAVKTIGILREWGSTLPLVTDAAKTTKR